MPGKKAKREVYRSGRPSAASKSSPGTKPAAPSFTSTSVATGKQPFKYSSKETTDMARPLTVREEQIVEQVANGKENLEIALNIRTGERNVEKHMKNIRQKIGAKTRTAVVRWWYERKIEQLELRLREKE